MNKVSEKYFKQNHLECALKLAKSTSTLDVEYDSFTGALKYKVGDAKILDRFLLVHCPVVQSWWWRVSYLVGFPKYACSVCACSTHVVQWHWQ